MPASISALQRERVRLFLRVMLVSGGIGAVYGALLRTGDSIFLSVLTGVLNGIVIAGAIGAIEIFLLREGTSMRRLVRLPFIAVVALKTLVYGAIVCAAIAGTPYLAHLLPGEVPPAPPEPRTALVTLGFSLATTAVFVIALQAAGLVGRRTFRDLVLGRYRQPRGARRDLPVRRRRDRGHLDRGRRQDGSAPAQMLLPDGRGTVRSEGPIPGAIRRRAGLACRAAPWRGDRGRGRRAAARDRVPRRRHEQRRAPGAGDAGSRRALHRLGGRGRRARPAAGHGPEGPRRARTARPREPIRALGVELRR